MKDLTRIIRRRHSDSTEFMSGCTLLYTCIYIGLVLIAFVIVLTSCSKDKDIIKSVSLDLELNNSKHIISSSISTDTYNFTLYDSCINDSISFSGLETSKITQYDDSLGFYIRYEIDLDNVVGYSKTNHIFYSGGGRIVDLNKQKFISPDTTNIINKIKMRVVYKSADNSNKIILKQQARFIVKDNVVLVQFDTGYIESCKFN